MGKDRNAIIRFGNMYIITQVEKLDLNLENKIISQLNSENIDLGLYKEIDIVANAYETDILYYD